MGTLTSTAHFFQWSNFIDIIIENVLTNYNNADAVFLLPHAKLGGE